LTQKEKQKNATAWTECRRAGGKMRIINLVGGTSYGDCIENAHFSGEAGLDAIAIVAPYYFKPADDTALAEFVAKVGESVPEMPVYFYHIPVLTGVSIPMAGFLKKISSMLPNFAGIKFTHEDFMDFLGCLNYDNGKYDILWGRDECLLSALVLGSKGGVGSTYNYAAPLYYALIRAFNEGNLAEAGKLQQKSIGMIELLGKYGGISTGKAYMRYVGLDCGSFRTPVRNMTDKMYDDFLKDIGNLNMSGLFSKK
jgi:N-acetylneuraminate lyase